MATIKNLTPHPITICNERGEIINIIESDGIVRLKSTTQIIGMVDGITITKTVFGEPEGLPESEEGTFFIVSQMVKSALSLRTDLLVPADVIRDEKGNIIGCKSLGQ